MSALKACRGAQYPLYSEFTFNVATDTVTNTAGTAGTDLKTVGTIVFDAINLPVNAIVIGGEVVTETAVTGSTAYNVSVGDSTSATRYMSAVDKTTAARTALTLTGYVGVGENIRVTVAPTVANATGGKITVRVGYVIRNRANEVVTV